MIPFIEKRGLIIASAFALAATILVVIWLNQEKQNLRRDAARNLENFQANTVEAVFAKTDIPRGRPITEDMLYTRFIAKESLPAEAVTSIARVVDRVVTESIRKDSLIPVDKLAWPTTQETTLAAKTPIGKRAMTISVDNISLLLGMIKPGDYVDVIGIIPWPTEVDGKQVVQPATVPLFQNVLILSVGTQLGAETEKESVSRRKPGESAPKEDTAPLITLSLRPEEANILAFVKEQGKVQLILRSPGDAETRPAQPTSWETVFKYLYPNLGLTATEENKEKEKEKKEEAPQVEIIRGFKKEMVPLGRGK